MRICGVACVMDSHELLRTTMTHLVVNGIRDFYLYDHGSDPDLRSALSAWFRSGEVRVTILRKETPRFFQSAMIGALTTLAELDGFETVLAFDADEFWCATNPERTLADQISREMGAGAATLRVPVLNYVQHRAVDTFDLGSLATCRYAVVPHVDPSRDDRSQVDDGMPFVAVPFPSKVIARLSSTVRFTEGQHALASSGDSGTEAESTGIIVRHLSLPARSDLAGKREHGRRRIQAGFAAGSGWQLQRLADMTDQELDAYWDSNSWHVSDDGRALVGSYDRLLEDGALVAIGRDLVAAVERLGREPNPEANEAAAIVRQIEPQRLDRLLERLVDGYGATELALDEQQRRALELHRELGVLQDQLLGTRSELERSDASVARLQRDLAGAASALETVEHSASWRLTAPLRAVRRRLHPPGR